MKEILLLRHGDYDLRTKSLNEIGKRQAAEARDKLVERGLTSRALVLGSTAIRASETAEIIANGLKVPLVLSERIEEAGNNAWLVKSLDTFLVETLLQKNAVLEPEDTLIVVTHAPLIQEIYGIKEAKDVPHGGIYDYQPGSWTNPNYL